MSNAEAHEQGMHTLSEEDFKAFEEALGWTLSQDIREALQTLCNGMLEDYRAWGGAPSYQDVRARTAEMGSTFAAALKVFRILQTGEGRDDFRTAASGIKFQFIELRKQASWTDFRPVIDDLELLCQAAELANSELQERHAKKQPNVLHTLIGRLQAFYEHHFQRTAWGKTEAPFARFCGAVFEALQLKDASQTQHMVQNYFKRRRKTKPD